MRGGTVFRTVGALVLILLLVPFVVFAVPQVIGAEQSYVVVSSSMSPTIHAGAAVIVNNVSAQAISVGDVITFRTGTGEESAVVTHRVVNVTERNGTRLFRTQGDANAQPDPGLVSPEELVGRVTLVIPYLGQAIAFLQSDVGLILLVGVPISLLILGELWDLAKAYRTSRQADDDSAPEPSPPRETAASNELPTNSDENHENSLVSVVKSRNDQSELIDSNERDSMEEWSFDTTDESSEQSPVEQPVENPDQSAENPTSFPPHRSMTNRPPEELTASQIGGELRDIERLTSEQRREYEREGYDIEQRRRELIEESNKRFAHLEELQEFIDRL
jgi:signal peptidase